MANNLFGNESLTEIINKANNKDNPYLYRPLQSISSKFKDKEWAARNIDWLEWVGLNHLRRKTPNIVKNYKIAAGILNKSDYIEDTSSEGSILDPISDVLDYEVNEDSPASIKFYPIIPGIINTLVDEFNKREIEVTYKAIDEGSINKVLFEKQQKIKEKLSALLSEIISNKVSGVGDEKQSEQIKQEILTSFSNIQDYINSSYRLNIEKVVTKYHEFDKMRFNLPDVFSSMMRDLLVASECFVEFILEEDDYSLEVWNPANTFYRKRAYSNFVDDCEYVGKTELMTVQEVIDRFGRYLDEKQIAALLSIRGGFGFRGPSQVGLMGNQGFSWSSQDGPFGTQGKPSIFQQDYLYWFGDVGYKGYDIVSHTYYNSQEGRSSEGIIEGILRVTKVYWKAIKKIGLVTKIDPITNQRMSFIVDDEYKPVLKPQYDTRYREDKSADNLIYGEHVEWFFVDEVWGGIKIGLNMPSFFNGDNTGLGFPFYIGIGCKEPSPIKYQFKPVDNEFQSSLPVTGYIFSDKNVRAVSIVDLCKPYQIAYNLVNNQIMDMLLDEIGSVFVIDQNTIPKTNMMEDIGTNPLETMYLLMKKYKMLPLDSSLANTGQPLSFNQFQQIVLEHSQRLQTRIQLAQYFQNKIYESIGLAPERMGRPTSEYQSGKASQINVTQSYGATEKYFYHFCDLFIPHFHQMRTDLLLWYLSNGKLSKIQSYINDSGERAVIESIDDDDISMTKMSVYPTTKSSYKIIIDQVKQLMFNNPNLGLNISDAVKLMQVNSYSQLEEKVRQIEERMRQAQEMAANQEKEKLKQEQEMKMEEIRLAYSLQEQMLDKKLEVEREKLKTQMLIEKIKKGDIDDDDNILQEDPYKYLRDIIKRDIKTKELETKKELKEKDLEIAKINNEK